MSTWHIYMLGSTRVHKHLRRPCMPEYSSESWTLRIYACVCICKACERCLLMELNVMKIIEVDFVVVWIFYSFNDVFVSSWVYKSLWGLIGLLSNYHNTCFIFWVFLITFVIWGWLFCHFSLPYVSSTVAWLSCRFMSPCWQASWDLLPCIWWNFFHCSLFHYSFCNIPDILRVWCFSCRFPYCLCLAFWCRRFFFCILPTISSCVFAYWYMLGHTCCMISLACSCSLLQCLLQLPIGI